MLRKIPLLMVAVVAGLVLFAGIARAQTIKSGANTNISASETIDSAAYLFGNTVDVAGTINGDLYCAGQTVNISGTVNGDVFCAGQTVNLSGSVTGSIRLAGQTVNVSGKATNATLMAQTATLSDNGVVAQDINGGAATFTISSKATVGRDLTYGASNVTINGTVGRNTKVSTEELTLGSSAKIGGNIAYTSTNSLQKSPDATVGGTVTQSIPKQTQTKSSFNFGFAGSFFFAVYLFFACLLVLIVLVLLFPGVYKDSAVRVNSSPWITLLLGFIALFAVPVALVMIAITVIGIPLAVLLGLIWLVILMLSGTFTAYYVGTLVLKNQKNAVLIMLTGGAIVLVLSFIPFIGFLVSMISTMLGTGIMLREIMRRAPEVKPSKKAS